LFYKVKCRGVWPARRDGHSIKKKYANEIAKMIAEGAEGGISIPPDEYPDEAY